MYEKCVLFIFLVILTILSCSGFRIDNLEMTDISSNNKRNFHHTSSTLLENHKSTLLNKIPADATTNGRGSSKHKIRHHRHLGAQQAHYQRFETEPQPPSGYNNHQFQQQHLQVATTNNRRTEHSSFPHPYYQTKQSRHPGYKNNNNHRHQQQQQQTFSPCQELDVTMKGYLADIVVIATAESMSAKRKQTYKVLFRINANNTWKNKTSAPIDSYIQLTFTKRNTTWNCADNGIGKPPEIVQIDVKKSREYILFLNSFGPHNYTAFGAPELIKGHKGTSSSSSSTSRWDIIKQKQILPQLGKVLHPNFKPRDPEVVSLTSTKKKITCKTKGFPIPRILWKLNGEPLSDTKYKRLNYKKRKSTLFIKDTGEKQTYECKAIGVNNTSTSQAIQIGNADSCEPNYNSGFCQNGGTCRFIPSMAEYFCMCAPGFSGNKCEEKTSGQSSMYPQTNNYSTSCKLGAMTKYYCNESESIENSSYVG